ncbi:MAG: ABC transporter permease subunit [Acidimicrobiia bacterium]|nr:ABC transporter permease subunit [Acidimicrobiia bacterium]
MANRSQPTEPESMSVRRSRIQYGRGFWLRLAALSVVNAITVYAAIVLVVDGAWVILAMLVMGTLFINWVYLWPRTQALRWVTPGLVFMVVFLAIPIGYTFYISLTNWATGNVLPDKDQAIEILERRTIVDPDEEGELFEMFVYQDDAGELRLLLVGSDERLIFGEPRLRSEEPVVDATLDPQELGVVDEDGDGVPETIGPYRQLERREVFALAGEVEFENLFVDLPNGQVEVVGLSQGRVVLSAQRFIYTAEDDVLFDTQLNVACRPGQTADTKGNFVCGDGGVLSPGWVAVTGVDNYAKIIGNERIRGPFVGVLVWNIAFALGSVVLSFAVGLGLALTMQHPRFRGTIIYRSIYILPYAIPAFLSILIWQGLLNEQFGQINNMLESLGLERAPWLTSGNWAKASVLLVNTWLTFPYMFLISTGALQAIPVELLEAARVDGAGAGTVFRRVTFPLLMVSLAPLLIGTFAFAFNNFVLIFLLTNGGPPIFDAAVPVGSTDILITFTFDLAFASGRGNDFALAAAISIFIFLFVAVISAFAFRYTRRLEEIYGSL